jgi:predicted enzyme related to lactoylglutathione lyase
VDFKLELVLIPVADVDRAKAFYTEKVGFTLDVDHQPSEEFRVVQMTPPGSACSITMGKGITDAEPGSYRGTHLVVADIEAARAELVARGVDVRSGTWGQVDGSRARTPSVAITVHSRISETPTATAGSCRNGATPR